MAVVMMVTLSATLVLGSEVDRLLDKLIEKGILTEGEAYKIREEAADEARKREASAKADTDKIPGWIKNTSFKGDARIRYEFQDREGKSDRNRARLRFRWGFDTDVNENLKAGFRVATGDSTQASSANQTFTNSFDDKPIWLDRAYIFYSPNKNISLAGGKIPNPFFNTNLVWSGDLNPEGIILQAHLPVPGDLFAAAGYLPLYEMKDDTDDPYMLGFQAGYAGQATGMKFKAAVSYYHFESLKGVKAEDLSPSFSNQGNTLAGGNYAYDYRLLNFTGEIVPFTIPLGENGLPLKLYADYVKNLADGVDDNEGYLLGIKLGSSKKKNTWEIGYDYRQIEADSVTDFMTDGSFCGGGTDSKGHTIGIKYAPSDNSTLGVTYIIAEALGKNKKSDINTLQVDFGVAF